MVVIVWEKWFLVRSKQCRANKEEPIHRRMEPNSPGFPPLGVLVKVFETDRAFEQVMPDNVLETLDEMLVPKDAQEFIVRWEICLWTELMEWKRIRR